MAFLAKVKKIDLQTLAVELGEKITEDLVVTDLISLIKKSKNFEDELVKNLVETIRDTRLEREGLEEKQRVFQEKQHEFELEKMRIEDEQKKRQFELDKLKIGSMPVSPSGAFHNDEFFGSRHSFVLKKIMHKFDPKEEDISLYLVIFERQAKRAEVKKADWVTQLLPLLPSDIIQLIAREPESKSDNYDHVKDLLLKRFKLSPEKFRIKFVQHQKKNDSSWKDFTFELRNYLEEWIQGLEITSFEQLKDLMVSDQLKRRACSEAREHFLDVWTKVNTSAELSEMLDEYDNVRSTRKIDSRSVYERKKVNPNFEQGNRKHGYFSKSDSNETNHKRQDVKFQNQELFDRRKPLQCWECGDYDHIKSQCTKAMKENYEGTSMRYSGEDKPTNVHITRVRSGVLNEEVPTKDVTLKDMSVTALVDTGCSVCLLREDIYKKDVGFPKLRHNPVTLSGIGQVEIMTKGSFKQDVDIDGCKYPLTWHVVPTAQLSYQAVIGVDILDQASINFSKCGIEFSKREKDVVFMHINNGNVNGKFKSCDIVELKDNEKAQKAIEIMHEHRVRGKLSNVKVDTGEDRKKTSLRFSDRGFSRPSNEFGNDHRSCSPFNTYGLNPSFLKSLGISRPLNNKVFISNLDYKVTERKLEEIFKIAGKLVKVKLKVDNEGKSKGQCTVEYEHPLEAVQAISVFNGQRLYARIMNVRMDKFACDRDAIPVKLPSGLYGIGKGLGINGQPLLFNKTSSVIVPRGSFGIGMGLEFRR